MPERIKIFFYSVVVATCLLLNACGFQLRGSDLLPDTVKNLYIQSKDETRFVKSLHRAMAVRGVQVVSGASFADARIDIQHQESGQRILSVAATDGPEEYEVYQIVRFSYFVDGEAAIDSHTFTLTRDYTYDRNDILGKQHEYESLRAALADEMADTMIRKIRFSK